MWNPLKENLVMTAKVTNLKNNITTEPLEYYKVETLVAGDHHLEEVLYAITQAKCTPSYWAVERT